MTNLLFILTDQQRADTAAPAGPCQMPHLQRLAGRGVRFERCYAPNPICAPVRASLFTGLLPHNHGMVDNPHTVEAYRANFKDGLPFWPRDLQRLGYRTAYFGKWHVERSLRLENFGFDEYEIEETASHGAGAHRGYRAYRHSLGLPETPAAPQTGVQVTQPGYKPFVLSGVSPEPVEATMEHYIFSRGIRFIEERAGGGQPWALVLSTLAPHDPYIVPRDVAGRCDPAQVRMPPSFHDDLAGRPAIYRRIQQVWKDLAWEDFARATASYYDFCAMLDDQLGRLLAALEASGQAGDTLVVYVSDHGDYLGAHRLMLKGIPAFDEAYRVPLVLAGPGIPAGRTVDQRVNHLDLAASMLGLLGMRPSPPAPLPVGEGGRALAIGRSLLPLLGAGSQPGEAQASGAERFENDQHFAECHGQRFAYTQRILWWRDTKYVFNGFDQDELYDLASDPYELHNLAQEPAMRPVIEEMASRMWGVMQQTGDANMTEAEYPMFRFAPVGPRAASKT